MQGGHSQHVRLRSVICLTTLPCPDLCVTRLTRAALVQVTSANEGTYRCRPFNLLGTAGESAEMRVQVRERPRFTLRPRNLYQRGVLDSVVMPCVVEGSPAPQVTWRRVSGTSGASC